MKKFLGCLCIFLPLWLTISISTHSFLIGAFVAGYGCAIGLLLFLGITLLTDD